MFLFYVLWITTTFNIINFQSNHKLQKVQNYAAQIITNTKKYDHVPRVFLHLNWLPIIF